MTTPRKVGSFSDRPVPENCPQWAIAQETYESDYY